jgi:hypothetical protein
VLSSPNVLPNAASARIRALEPFDEHAEWRQKCAHYVMVSAACGAGAVMVHELNAVITAAHGTAVEAPERLVPVQVAACPQTALTRFVGASCAFSLRVSFAICDFSDPVLMCAVGATRRRCWVVQSSPLGGELSLFLGTYFTKHSSCLCIPRGHATQHSSKHIKRLADSAVSRTRAATTLCA